MEAQFKMIRNANVEASAVRSSDSGTRARIVINGQYEHTFPRSSRVSKHLELMEASDLSERLSHGNFFLVNINGTNDDEDYRLVDFRDGSYNGFVHHDDVISEMMQQLGVAPMDALPIHLRRGVRRRDTDAEQTSLSLRKVWSDTEIEVPEYSAGGNFFTQLAFKWNPFVKNIDSEFSIVRQVCSNGMTALAPFLNTKIPVYNRWEEHLDIAARQIQMKVDDVVTQRIKTMALQRAPVAACMLLHRHISDRLKATRAIATGERERLLAFESAVDVQEQLAQYYRSNVFNNRSLAAQLPSHLTRFDAWNIASEIRTHTHESGTSSQHALDRIANEMMFESDDFLRVTASKAVPKESPFSSPERAFWGLVN